MSAGDYVVIAHVMRTHGLKGEVSVTPATEAPLSSLVGEEVWFVPPPDRIRADRVTSTRQGPKGVLMSFAGTNDINGAQDLIGCDLLVDAALLPHDVGPAEQGTCDGYCVADKTHGDLGEIVETIVTGANDVWVVRGTLGEVLVPVIDDVVVSIDHDGRSVSVDLLPGLLPEDGTKR